MQEVIEKRQHILMEQSNVTSDTIKIGCKWLREALLQVPQNMLSQLVMPIEFSLLEIFLQI